MTDPTPLSPAAQAVLDAFIGENTIYGLHLMTPRLAAALRAAVDQVMPVIPPNQPGDPLMLIGIWGERHIIRTELLAIAAELKGAQ